MKKIKLDKKNKLPKKLRLRKKNKLPKKRKRLKYIAILPSLITLMNGICGFFAIILASNTDQENIFAQLNISIFALAGYIIFLGMIADALDGHVARISKSTSEFGAQLDSLCDAVSFGIAPAFLMLKLVEEQLKNIQAEAPRFAMLYGRIIYLIAIIYAVCAIIRLARFNVEDKDASHSKFAGLPSPAAAGAVVSIIVFKEDFISFHNSLEHTMEYSIVWGLPIVTLIVGILMITRIPYTHLMNRFLKGKKSFSAFLLALLIILFAIWSFQFAMVFGFCLYVIYGIIHWIYLKISKIKKPAQDTEAPTVNNSE